MKDDAPTPEKIPTKRRQLREALDRWLVEWLTRPTITPAEAKRVERERARRKTLKPTTVVGVLAGREGLTPEQREYVRGYFVDMDPTVMQTGTEAELSNIVRSSNVVVAAPPRSVKTGAVWEAVRLAKHRHVPVRVVLPNGKEVLP